MDPVLLAVAAFGLFFAGVVKGTTGIGYSSCALPFLVPVVGLQTAIVLIVMPAILSNVFVALNAGHFREIAARFWPLYLATPIGIVVGIAFLSSIDQRLAIAVLGSVIVAYAVISLAQPNLSLREPWDRILNAPVGFFTGLLTGLTGSQVMPLLPYMMALHLEPNRLIQAINLAVTITSIFLGAGLMLSGLMDIPTLALSLFAVIPALVGVSLGNRARNLLPVLFFRRLMLLVLLAIGIMFILRG
ncbi:conserved membrane protein of unknown function [Candidatus Filomicrobium marinum]|uniref:Probable membrane transporter protein n=2 Tax=Filomicrobium TaxID=119044 RepID=A0A0D6JFI7_9HYPH|nr:MULTISPECIES: sulfite exporter TauE/SafE family protein [Filomicrobium]MCV0370150.1 sulfite exporter TauE/SafE family protein [Filomicrobium sp.]CFX25517.1 conserved membrane protein of unknown function [Candidatus Filomicrobium marinum]CPR19309.1 conserved membrane protein of unknown function [Candidatus Filomicrobium marinum]SDO09128.1 hypothetical protein SAMN04488061_0233 [Filomicrobium insigne]